MTGKMTKNAMEAPKPALLCSLLLLYPSCAAYLGSI